MTTRVAAPALPAVQAVSPTKIMHPATTWKQSVPVKQYFSGKNIRSVLIGNPIPWARVVKKPPITKTSKLNSEHSLLLPGDWIR